MAKRARSTKGRKRKTPSGLRARIRQLFGILARAFLGVVAIMVIWITLYVLVAPPSTPYILSEARRLGEVQHEWMPMGRIAPELQRAVVAAEDANFCLHWGFDMAAIREAIDAGANRGASTISQQTVKNAFLWQGRSWLRKALEALITPVAEAIWPKRRMLEIYLNIVEFDTGVFGAEAAAQHYFGVSAANLNTNQAARLAAVLPDPQGRSASNPSARLTQRAAMIRDGAATIRADGRDSCFAN